MDQVSHRMAAAREGARQRVEHAREGAQSFMNDNPLAVGALALAIGAGVGLLLPHTHTEDRIIGERRDRLLGRGKQKLQSAVEDAKEVAKHAAEEATRVAKEELSERGYDVEKGQTTPGGMQAPTKPDLSGPEEFDSTLGRRPS